MSPNRKSRIKLFRNPLTALALLYAVVLLGCAPEGTTQIMSYHGFLVGVGSPRRHPGVDFVASTGDPVIAAADGVVVQAGFEWGCGNGVSIEHRAQEAPLGWTLYCHFTEINVREGQTVKRGDVLGTAGTSGQTGGIPHVHFGLCPNKPCPWYEGFDDNVDPLAFIVGCFNPARPNGYSELEASEGGSRLVLTYPVRCTGVASPVMWKRENGAFFRLVKCTTSLAARQGGHRRNAPWASVSASRSERMRLSRSH